MTNDNRRPMSPFGRMLFEVFTSDNRVILTDDPDSIEPDNPYKRMAAVRTKPPVLLTIRRPSKGEKK